MNNERINKIMDQYGLDALVASSSVNVAYFSGFHALSSELLGAPMFVVIPRSTSEAALVVPLGEAVDLFINKMSRIKDVRTYGRFFIEISEKSNDEKAELVKKVTETASVDALTALKTVLDEKGLTRSKIGMDESGFFGQGYSAFLKMFADCTIIPSSAILQEIRMVKTPSEFEILRDGNRIAETAIRETIESISPGINGNDIVKIFTEAANRGGAISLAPGIGLGEDSIYKITILRHQEV